MTLRPVILTERPSPHTPTGGRPQSRISRNGGEPFFSLLIITVSFLPIFVLGEQSGRLFKPLAYTKTFAMAAASVLAITIIPVLMLSLITSRVLPKKWGWKWNLAITLAAMFVPAALLGVVPLGPYEAERRWFMVAWIVLLGMLLVPQKIFHERVNPISKVLQWLYNPFFAVAMRHRKKLILLAI